MNPPKKYFVLFSFIGLMTSGCALMSKGEALSVRWFDPELAARPHITSAQPTPARAPANRPTIELGRVSSGINLREKIAYRDAAFEVGFYDDKRWTERPEVYVRRELSRTLYEEHGFKRGLVGESPVLEIEVVKFEELRGKTPAARIQVRMLLHDDRNALVEKTITVDKPIAPDAKGFEGLVQAMAEALDSAAEMVVGEAETALTARAASTTTKESRPQPTDPR